MARVILDEKAIFNVAREIASPDARAEYLRQACGTDSSLFERIQVLLRAYEGQASFLESPPVMGVSPTIDQPVAETPGTVIGPYKLLQQIGEGGMGVVWMAEQTQPVQRKVALKVIKPGMDSRQVIARFEAERQALAMMDHVNIARVFDGGTTPSPPSQEGDKIGSPPCEGGAWGGGRPYFVMELVHGIPITKYCDDNHLTPRERLELFVPVCQAIQHAHQKGIIHRDIKPSNVMVTPPSPPSQGGDKGGGPVPKVIDFGVAKATEQKLTERTLFTQYGTMVGTLEYMSPEQAEMSALGVDTRSDIYSLGVLLYELLTGSTPLTHQRMKEAAYAEILRMIKEEEPPKPSTRLSESKDTLASISANRHTEPAKLTKLVRGELDWIVMKTLEKDRERRYETANEFSLDLQRYLADEPVLACPPTVGYRLRKFVRRNKGPVVAVGLVLLVLVAGIIGTTLGLFQARSAAEAARNAKEAETTQRLRAEANAKLAVAVLDEIFLKGARQRQTFHTQDEAKGLAKNPERQKLERELLEKGLKFYEQLAQTNPTDWTARRERAGAYRNVGLLRLDLMDFGGSENAFRQAVHLMEELASERPSDPELQDNLARSCDDLAQVLQQTGQMNEAEKAYRQARAIWEKLGTDRPERLEYRQYATATLAHIAALLAAAKRTGEAEEAYRQTRASLEKRMADFPGEPAYSYEGGFAYLDWNLGNLLRDTGQAQEAEKLYRRALAAHEKLAGDYPAEPVYRQEQAFICWLLGGLLQDTGRAPEAEKFYRQAVAVGENLVANYPDSIGFRLRLSQYLGLLAENLLQQGKHAEAAKVAEKFPGARPKDANGYQKAALFLARCMALAGKDAKLAEVDRKAVAQAYADRARELMQEAAKLGLDTPGARELQEALRLPRDDPQAHYKLGVALFTQGWFAESEAECREALRHRPDHVEAHYYLGKALTDQGKHAEAEAEFREALRLRPEFRQGYVLVGFVLGRQGKPAAALRFYTDSFAAEPTLADDLRFANRYNAACCAALVGCGHAKDAAPLDAAERARLRRQALDWLRADLAAWGKLLEKEPDKTRLRVQQQLRHWQQDTDFAGVRGDALAKLPEAERVGWQQFWADVEQTLKRANDKDTKDTKKKSPN